MFEDEGNEFQPFDREDEELVRRLRDLEWPAVNPEVRERCWSAFVDRLEGDARDDADRTARRSSEGDGQTPRRNVSRRESYTRRESVPREPLAGYSRAPRRWQERSPSPLVGARR
jgi:hypothetical protein